jgi:hypothetical protein
MLSEGRSEKKYGNVAGNVTDRIAEKLRAVKTQFYSCITLHPKDPILLQDFSQSRGFQAITM